MILDMNEYLILIIWCAFVLIFYKLLSIINSQYIKDFP